MNAGLWKVLARPYAEHLQTSTEEVHFGVGIPGNLKLKLIPSQAGHALDLGCGAGENMAALMALGYEVTGVDFCQPQLDLASKLLTGRGRFSLVCGDICDALENLSSAFDVVISVGAAHFCSDLDSFLANCARALKPGGSLILSLPHPVDMAVNFSAEEQSIQFGTYFPPERRIKAAHYWQKFAGSLPLSEDLVEFICRPSDVINGLVAQGLTISSVLEPEVDFENAPCTFTRGESWFEHEFCRRVPQYLIVCARKNSK